VNIQSLAVKSSSHSYNVLIGIDITSNLSALLEEYAGIKPPRKLALLSDENVIDAIAQPISTSLSSAGFKVKSYSLESGESTKSISKVYPVYQWLIENSFDRKDAILAIGGGVTGDAVGYIAASYLRGVPLIQIPTTLLAMVDSSIGGKVAINHELGKNLIGQFYPPRLVVVDIANLRSLPEREFACGLAECVKHGLISGYTLFEWMEENQEKIMSREENVLVELIRKNLEVKAGIVQRDEMESGERAFLNLGHTFAHALEKELSYSNTLLHGEAVSLGLLAAVKLSEIRGKETKNLRTRLSSLLQNFNLPISMKLPSIEKLMLHMGRDKKVESNAINFVLLEEPSKLFLDKTVREDEVVKAWESIGI
jgi:3-dehydroquinate synthase